LSSVSGVFVVFSSSVCPRWPVYAFDTWDWGDQGQRYRPGLSLSLSLS